MITINCESKVVWGLGYSEQLTQHWVEGGRQLALSMYLRLDFKCELNLRILYQEGRHTLIQPSHFTDKEPEAWRF